MDNKLKSKTRLAAIQILAQQLINNHDIEIVKVEKNSKHIKPTQQIIKKYNGLWFNDEILVIEKK